MFLASQLKSSWQAVKSWMLISSLWLWECVPGSSFAQEAGLEIGKRGGIVTNSNLQTSDPDIYAVGDAIEVTNPISGEQVIVPLQGLQTNRQDRS